MGAFNNLTLVKVGAAERRDYLGGDGQTVAEALRIHHGLLATPLSTDGMHLFEQLLPYSRCDRLLLGHGAGMIWGLFLKPQSTIVEVIAPEKITKDGTAIHGLHRIAHAAGAISFVRITSRNLTASKTDVEAVGRVFHGSATEMSHSGCCRSRDGALLMWPACPYSNSSVNDAASTLKWSRQSLPFVVSDHPKPTPTFLLMNYSSEGGIVACSCCDA